MPPKKNGCNPTGNNNSFKKIIGLIILCIITLSLIIIPGSPGISHVGSPDGTLLEDRFGVHLSLLPSHDGVLYPSFDLDSFHPTKNNNSIQYTIRDWYGNWNYNSWNVNTVWGDTPAGGEWYDVEVIYFDLNVTHLFIIVVTSVPFYTQWDGEWGVGVKEPRWVMPNNWVRPGDLCLDFNLSVPRVELFGRQWSYDYGIDLVHENRDNKYPLNYGNTYMRDNDLGSSLYRTLADPGGKSIQDPGYGYDWYTASWFSTANWKHTNFDPLSSLSSSTLEKMGDETDGIITNYYQYEFTGEWAGYEENNAETWVIETTIPIQLFKEGDWPPPGGTMGIQWISSCRNDAPVAAHLEVTLPVQLGDFVWEDLDTNGIQDMGEPGIGGVTVNLLNESLVVLDSRVTDDSGGYLFSNLPPGGYCVQVEAPEGFMFTSQDVGDDAHDSDADVVSGVTGMVMLGSGMTDMTVDAGLYRLVSVGDFVWEDLDADGIQDTGETGLRDVTVNLYYKHNDTLACTTTTNATGHYLFTNQVPDDYYVNFILPSGYLFSPRDHGSDDTVDSDADTTGGTTASFTLTSGETDLTWDAGVYLYAFLGDFVWEDLDANGLQDTREDGLESIEVSLYYHDGTLVGSTMTNATGYYRFMDLSPGIYHLRFMLPPGYSYSPRDMGDNDALDSDANFLGFTDLITLVSNVSDMTWDCGMFSGAKRIIPPPYIDEQGIEYITNTTRIFLNFTDGTLDKTFFRVWKWDMETTDWYLLFDWLSADEGLHHDPPLYPIDLCTIGDYFNVGCCGYYELEYYYDNLTVMYWNDIYVDCTPPTTTKTYGVPSHADTQDPIHIHWITPLTSINLTAHDPMYGSGPYAIYYRMYYPNQTLYTIPLEDTWALYMGNFTIQGRQGVYQIEYYSVDNVGNPETPVIQTAILGCPWDLNGDGTVNILDVIRIVNHLGETGDPWWIPEDLAGSGPQGLPDGEINILDIISAANHWGTCPLEYP